MNNDRQLLESEVTTAAPDEESSDKNPEVPIHDYDVDPQNSSIEIRLGTSGIFGFLGDEHLIRASILHGQASFSPGDAERSSVRLEISADQLKVLDPKLTEEKRSEVQRVMESDRVLDVKKFQRILFQSSRIRMEKGRFTMTGDLTLRGQTRSVTVQGRLERDRPPLEATGNSRFKQTTFGITPVTAGVGTVRVKDEIEVTFRMTLTPKAGGAVR